MDELIAALGAIRLRDANDAQHIAAAIKALQELEQDRDALRVVVDALNTELAIARCGYV